MAAHVLDLVPKEAAAADARLQDVPRRGDDVGPVLLARVVSQVLVDAEDRTLANVGGNRRGYPPARRRAAGPESDGERGGD